jgi:glutaredoxin 3
MSQFVNEVIKKSPVTMIAKSFCPYCQKAKALLTNAKIEFYAVDIENRPDMEQIQDYLKELTGARTVPRVFVGGKSIGGCDDTTALLQKGELMRMVEAAGGKIAK